MVSQPMQTRETIAPGAAELLQKLAQAQSEEDKEAVKAAVVGTMITSPTIR